MPNEMNEWLKSATQACEFAAETSDWNAAIRGVIGAYTAEVNRRAEANMLKTGRLEGAHHAAMRLVNQELGIG